MKLSQFIERVPTSATIEMAQKARSLKEAGADVISLSLGEPDFDTPKDICQAAQQAIDDGYTRYTPVPGLLSLRKAICQKLMRDNSLAYDPSQIVVSTGAKQSIANAVLCLVNPGDEVILPAPYWVSYAGISKMAGASIVPIKTSVQEDFKVSPQALRKALTEKTRLIIFSSPCNPTGSVYSQQELEDLAAVLADYPQVYVLADEIYEYINFGDIPHASLAAVTGMYDRVITVNGVSKGYAMTGWRIGYMAGPQPLAKACAKLQGQFTSGASAVSQKAAEAAISGGAEPCKAMRDTFLKRRDFVVEELRKIEGFTVNVPEGAFYVFPDVSDLFGKTFGGRTLQNADDVVMYLLEEHHVALVAGTDFGSPDCVRISYAASMDQLQEALNRMKKAFTA